MVTPEQKVSVSGVPVEIFEYDNGSVVFLNAQLPSWVRSSSTGLWIFQHLKDRAGTASETVDAVAAHYDLPARVVRESVMLFLSDMIFNGFMIAQDSAGEERPSIISRVVELPYVGLHEMSLDVTAQCRGACQHCYKSKRGASHFPIGELEELLTQARSLGPSNLTITGGEPLLHPEFSYIMALARRVSDWTIRVITTGQNRSSEALEALMKNADIVQVSLDGLDKATNDLIRGEGAFECAVALLKVLRENKNTHGKRIGIAFTPIPENINQMENMCEWAYRMGIDFIHLNHVKPRVSLLRDTPKDDENLSQDVFKRSLLSFEKLTADMWNVIHGAGESARPVSLDRGFAPYHDLFSRVKRRTCGAGITTLSITEEGDVYPCVALQTFRETHLGNWLRQRDLSELYSRARRWSESAFSVDACPECRSCSLRYLCGGGCRARAYPLARPDMMCKEIRKSYEEFFEAGTVLVQTRTGEARRGNLSEREIEANNEERRTDRFRLRRCT